MIVHSHNLRVYFEDTDAGGVMYHAAYLGFAERARTEALRDAGLPHAAMLNEHGVMFMVRRVQIEYLRPPGWTTCSRFAPTPWRPPAPP